MIISKQQAKYVCAKSLPKKYKNNTLSFGGNLGHEVVAGKLLRQETSFFRDVKTLEFVKDYIKEAFAEKEKIKVVVGACSSGEESISLSMLLESLNKKIEILGFDLGEKVLKQAKSRKYTLSTPQKVPEGYISPLKNEYISAYKDSFLCFEQKNQLSYEQKKYKNLFEAFFDQIEPPKKDSSLILSKKLMITL